MLFRSLTENNALLNRKEEKQSFPNRKFCDALDEYNRVTNECVGLLKNIYKEEVNLKSETSHCDVGFGVNEQERQKCAQLLLTSIERQSDLIREAHFYVCNMQLPSDTLTERIQNLEKRVQSLTDRVEQLSNLFCKGRCGKHGKTPKCFCRGFSQSHRCCGRLGGICEC